MRPLDGDDRRHRPPAGGLGDHRARTTPTARTRRTSADPAIELRPCGGVGVTATNGTQSYRTTSSTGDGSFLLTGVPPGTYSMSFERAGYSTRAVHHHRRRRRRGRPGHHRPVRAARPGEPGHRLGAPVRRLAWPTCRSPGSPPRCSASRTTPLAVSPPRPPGTTPVDLAGLLPGTYNVRITADEHDAALVQVQIPLGTAVNGGTVLLTPLASIGGLVSGFQSQPVPGAVVFVTPDPTDPNAGVAADQPEGHAGRPRRRLPQRRSGRRRGAPLPAQRGRRRLARPTSARGCARAPTPAAATTSSA